MLSLYHMKTLLYILREFFACYFVHFLFIRYFFLFSKVHGEHKNYNFCHLKARVDRKDFPLIGQYKRVMVC